jgi:hypothetical protein
MLQLRFRKECTLIMCAYINRPLLPVGCEATASNKRMRRRPRSEFLIAPPVRLAAPLMRAVRRLRVSRQFGVVLQQKGITDILGKLWLLSIQSSGSTSKA